jgi:hypothetical protein
MNLYSKIGLALMLAAAGAGYHHHVYQSGYDTAVAERAARDGVAVLHRAAENVIVADKQASINAVITKAKYEELAPVRSHIAAERVRVGAGICPAAGSSDAEGAAGGDGADPPGRLVRSDVERDIRALKLAVEDDLSTGRACQAFVRENGMVP